jgi:predicted GNAT superfamily acetyltransferase
MAAWTLRLLDTPADMKAAEDLQLIVWPGSPIDVVPDHLLITLAHNGSPVIGAFEQNDDNQEVRLIGVAFGFPGMDDASSERQYKFCSHQVGVHPDFEGAGIGFALKRAQWQMARQQGYARITWTYDPLLSRNAYLNIAKLGTVCNTYKREVYGEMRDGLNVGFPSDRFQVDWWLNTPRVEKHLDVQPASRLNLQHYLEGGAVIINPGVYTPEGSLSPPSDTPQIPDTAKLLLVEIPSNIQALKKAAPDLALSWRLQTRQIFEALFSAGYLVTDFVYQPGPQPRSYYLLSYGESTF